MTIESFRTKANSHKEVSYSWFSAKPFVDGSVYFWKLNKFLEKETFSHRWWIVKHKDTGRTFAQGLWTPTEVNNFLREIKWERGEFFLPTENFAMTHSLGDTIYSIKTLGVVAKALIREKIIKREDDYEGINPKYFPTLNLIEAFVATLYSDKLYSVNIRPTQGEPGKVWFELRTPNTS